MSQPPRSPQGGALPAAFPQDLADAWQEPPLSAEATLVAALLAVDGAGLGGVALRSPACSARSQWLDLLRRLLPEATPWRRLPLHASSAALLGGLDLGASLQTGSVKAQPGLLAQSHQGWLVLGMAERVPAHMAAQLCAVLDTHEVRLEREGLTQRHPARLALVALDEGLEDDEQLPAALLDRLAFQLPLETRQANLGAEPSSAWSAADIARARHQLAQVSLPDRLLEAVCAASLALGIGSLRAPLMAVRAARALAALEGQTEVSEAQASLAVRLVLAPRATRLPAAPAEAEAPAPEEADTPPSEQAHDSPQEPSEAPDSQPDSDSDGTEDAPLPQDALEEMLIQAALASLPPGLLAALKAGQMQRSKAQSAGRAGALQKSLQRGRPVGTRRGELRSGARLHLLDTLRAAAPWQRWRRQQAGAAATAGPVASGPRILVQREDFHVRQFRQNRTTTTVFVVDASGSAALHRLSEAKGAVELLLAECYVRRDRAAVVAFRGPGAEVLLPPTRSLARAKRSLAALPAGGGTPLATGLDTAHALALQIARQGDTPVVVVLTDGRANLGRDGRPGRAQAAEDALAAARQFKLSGLSALLIDTSAQPQATAQALAQSMGASYIALPHGGAKGLSQVVRAAQASPGKSGR
jgi:magnesium chelatase subunit D